MRRAERIILALGALGEARKPPALPNGAQRLAPAGQDLVRIGLMTHIPDQPVNRRVEHIMQRNRQLDNPEPRTQMSPGLPNRINHLAANLVRKLTQLGQRKSSHVRRIVYTRQ